MTLKPHFVRQHQKHAWPRLRRVILCLLFLALIGGLAQPATAPERVAAAPAAVVSDWRFGVIESYEDTAAASELGAAWTRVVFHWAETQPGGAGTWTPKVSDEQINAEINSGRVVVGLLIGIPGWAQGSNGIPSGLWQPHTDPGNAWATFVGEAVSRYQGRIDHWIIWNEPDIGSGAIAHTWGGTVNDFFQLQRTAYLVAKEVNPAAVIHLSAFTYWADANAGREQYMARLLDEILADPAAADHNYYFDVATAHLYFQTTQVFDLLQFFLGVMRQRGMNQPIWLMETNVPPFDDPTWPVASPFLAASLDEQAAFMPQVMASALAAGAQRIAIYKLKDTPSDRAANPEPFGLVRLDGSRRPAFTTYQQAMRYMSGITGIRRERWDGVGQVRLDQGNQSTTVLFARLPQSQLALVPAKASFARLVDMWGGQREIAASDGFFSVTLPGAACSQTVGDYCMIGGTTYYLVQFTDGRDPPVTTTPTATDTASPTPTLTPSSTPTETPSPIPTETPTSTATAQPTETPTYTPRPSMTASATAEMIAEIVPAATAVEIPSQQVAAPEPVVSRDSGNLSYWFIGVGMLLAIGLVVTSIAGSRRRS